jgi:translation initiation factor eIF-2B subunit delta
MGFTRAEEALDRILRDRESGSLRLAGYALDCLHSVMEEVRAETVAEFCGGVERMARRLAVIRPAMASITNVVAYVVYTLKAKAGGSSSVEELKRVAHHTIHFLRGELDAAVGRVARAFSKVGGSHRSFLTLSFSTTVLGALSAVQPAAVIVAESAPRFEGRRLALELARRGCRVTVTLDFAAVSSVERVDAVVLGADSVCEDGSVVNKVGSRALALAARASGRPVYALFDRWKLVPECQPGQLISEQEDPSTFGLHGEGVETHAPLFEAVEPKLITHYVSEFGPLTREEVFKRARELLPMRRTVIP